MSTDYILDVSESDFDLHVINYSHQTPVVADFWAEWCKPCKILGPLLEKIAREFSGTFRLAKVNVDQNPKLAIRFGVHSIPHVKSFRGGQTETEFVGIQPEAIVREFIRALAPSPADLLNEKAASLYQINNWTEASKSYRMVCDQDPNNTTALLGLSKCCILTNDYSHAIESLTKIGASKEYKAANALIPLVNAILIDYSEMNIDETDLLATSYNRAIRLIVKGNIQAALDGLIEIIRANRKFRNGLPKVIILGLFELLGDENPVTIEYRKELASVIF